MQALSLGAAPLAIGCPVRPREQKRSNTTCKIEPTLTGYLGKDAVLGTTRNQTPFAVLSLATHRTWKDRSSGERQSTTTWHRCIVFGKLASYAGTLTKGAFLQLEGEIRTREYFPRVIADGTSSVKKSITEIRVFRIMNLDRPARPSRSGEPAA
jgi:single-strand DNA-binding protein